MFRRNLWPLLLLVPVAALCASATTTPMEHVQQTAFSRPSQQAGTAVVRNSEFAAITHTSAPGICESAEPPQAIATPNPLLAPSEGGTKVKVSFIVGTDGRIHSPLILESAGASGDRSVLQAVHSWRYRPATCNGVPTETEGKIEFSKR